MRQKLLSEGAKELSYEIREIVKKADQLKKLGLEISWENIGDPIQKHHKLPDWIKNIVSDLAQKDDVYSYCPSKGMLETREFLARQTNAMGGVQITPDDICFFNGLGDAIGKVYQYITDTSRVIGPSPAYSALEYRSCPRGRRGAAHRIRRACLPAEPYGAGGRGG